MYNFSHLKMIKILNEKLEFKIIRNEIFILKRLLYLPCAKFVCGIFAALCERKIETKKYQFQQDYVVKLGKRGRVHSMTVYKHVPRKLQVFQVLCNSIKIKFNTIEVLLNYNCKFEKFKSILILLKIQYLLFNKLYN